MSNKVKVIGLTLIAVAILTVIVTAGQADDAINFKAQNTVEDKDHETIDEIGIFEAKGGADSFRAFGVTIGCGKSEFKGEIAAFGSPSTIVSPHYSECAALEGNLLTTVTTNGCHYAFTIFEKLAQDTYSLTSEVICGETEKIEFHVYASAKADGEKKSLCTFTIGAQQKLQGLHATVNTLGLTDVTISGTLKGIKVTQDKNWPFCPPGEVDNAAEYHISGEKGLTIQTRNEAGKTIDFTIN